MELCSSNIEKNQGTETPKKFLIFQEIQLCSSNIKKFQGTETPKKILYILRSGISWL